MPGAGWFDYWTGLEVEGETKPDAPFEVVKEMPALDRLPIFVRPGAIIPKQPVTQSTSEDAERARSNCTSIPARIAEVKFTGTTASALRGDSLRQTVRCTLGKDGLMLHFDKREGRSSRGGSRSP